MNPLRVARDHRAFTHAPDATRDIVFYAEDGASWPHFEPIVRHLTGTMRRTISYLTSSPDDPILHRQDPRIYAYLTDTGFARAYLFQTMRAGVVVATVPQLGIPVLPRSRHAADLGTRYVYVFHSMASTHMIYEPDGFDHYDIVCCVGPYMAEEIRARETQANLPAKQLVEHGYGRLDSILRHVATTATTTATATPSGRLRGNPPVAIVAPSWGPTCLFETVGADVVHALLEGGFEVIARPHPMTHRRTPEVIPALVDRFGSHGRFSIDGGMAGFTTLLRSDLMVSDWSGAALEYAFGLERPVLFIDGEPKVNNPSYTELGIEPFEVGVRREIGRVILRGDVSSIATAAHELLAADQDFPARIRSVRTRSIHNVGRSGVVAAEHLAAQADTVRAGRHRGTTGSTNATSPTPTTPTTPTAPTAPTTPTTENPPP